MLVSDTHAMTERTFQVNIKSLEDVVRAYLKLAEEKTETAKEESQQMVLDIEDLDNIQTPER